MKKLVIIATALVGFLFTVNAQQINFGVKAGVNFSSFGGYEGFNGTVLDEYGTEAGTVSEKQNGKTGFHVGVNMQCMFTEQLGIETGLFFSTLGTKITHKASFTDTQHGGEWTYNPMYLQLPIQALYKFTLAPNVYLYPSAGVYLGYGIAGKSNGGPNLFGENSDDLGSYRIANRFDAGLIGELTFQYTNFTFGFGYQYGLTNVSRKIGDIAPGRYLITGNENPATNRNFKISVGYFF